MTASPTSPLPQDPDTLNAAAVQALESRQLDQAARLLRRALALAPASLPAHGNLGNLGARLQAWPESIACYRRGLAINAGNPVLHLMLGTAWVQSGELAAGMRALLRAIELRPGYAAAHANLGNALIASLDVRGAEAQFRKAISADPALVVARIGLARALRDQWRPSEAAAQARLALVLAPASPGAFLELTNAERVIGGLAVSLVASRRALDCDPADAPAISTYLFGLHFDPGASGAAIAEAHRRLGGRIQPRFRRQPRSPAAPGTALRVGFVSADFRTTPASWFLMPVLAGRNRSAWQAVCYADVGRPDATTARFRSHADGWHDIAGWTDERVAAAIGTDRIDVLFDLAGHTAGSRLSLFAARAAPIQASWLGYNDTTGLPQMDFILADPIVVPPGEDAFYTERVIRLRDGFLCYAPPDYAPPVAGPPMEARGYPTFGCYGQLLKIADDVLRRWSGILAQAQDARLIVTAPGLGDPALRSAFLARLLAHGLPAARVELRPQREHADYLASFADVDLMLDTAPYGAGTTACEALWMGVPIVTLPSDRLLGRQAASHLRNVGLPEFIASDAEDYVDKALRRSRRADALAEIRSGLRERMRASPLVDQARFAASFAQSLEEMRRLS
jgi:tetratricopeptide (TPR) repeat protein